MDLCCGVADVLEDVAGVADEEAEDADGATVSIMAVRCSRMLLTSQPLFGVRLINVVSSGPALSIVFTALSTAEEAGAGG